VRSVSVLSEYLETVGYLSHLQRKLLREQEEILLDKIQSGNFTLYIERAMQIFSKQFNNTQFVQHGIFNPTIFGKYCIDYICIQRKERVWVL